MGALPRPDLPDGPHRDLVDALHELHHRAGWPSLRRLAVAAGCSHTTVSHVFSSPRLPTWGGLELLVEAMAGDLATFRALWLAASAPAGDASPPPRIAGRRAEVAAVRRHLEHGRGLLLVTGDAGMGKTRLIQAAASECSGIFVAAASCRPLSVEVPLLPLAELLRSVYEHDQRWMHEALAACPHYVLASVGRLLPQVAEPGTPSDPDDEWSLQRLHTAVQLAFRELAKSRPLAVVLEDLHWADGATRDLVESLLARGPTLPSIFSWRLHDNETPDPTRDWFGRVHRLPGVTSLTLLPLTRDETAEQLRLLDDSVTEAEVDRIHARSLGLPLFTEQLVSHGPGELPRQLEDSLDRRLEDLPGAAWRVARALGVADRPLSDAILIRSTELQRADLDDALHLLRDRGLLTVDHTARSVELCHPLFADAVRRRLVPGEAADQHRRLARALSEEDTAQAAEVAAHWQEAGDQEAELGWRIRAALDASERFAHAQEAEQWLRALEVWPQDLDPAAAPPMSRVKAALAAMYALEASSQTRRAADLAEAALASGEVTDPLQLGELCAIAADYRQVLSDNEEALGLAQRAVEILQAQPPSVELVLALRTRASLLLDEGRRAEAEADIAQAVEVNEAVGDARQSRRLLGMQAWFDFASGRVDLGLERIVQAAGPPPEPDPLGDAYIAMLHTDMLLESGAPAATVEAAGEPALRLAEVYRIESQLISTTRSNVADALFRSGRITRAAEVIDQWTNGAVRREDWALQTLRVELDTARGLLDIARQRLDQIDGLRLGARVQRDYLNEARADLLLWSGQPAQAWQHICTSIRSWLDSRSTVWSAPLFLLGARAVADLRASNGRHDLAAELATMRSEMVDDPFEADGPDDALSAAMRATFVADLERAQGRDGLRRWVAAASAWDPLERPHDAAYCRWRGAHAALGSGDASVAARLLRRAARDAREHVPLSEAIRAGVNRAGQRPAWQGSQ